MATIEDIAVNVLAEAPECPSSVAEYAVRRSARELCRVSRCWRVTIGLPLVANLREIDVSDYLGSQFSPKVLDIISVARADGGARLMAKTQAQLDRDWPNWREYNDPIPLYYTSHDGLNLDEEDDGDTLFQLVPSPSTSSESELITDVSQAAAAVVTLADEHQFVPGDRIRLSSFNGMTNSWDSLDEKEYEVIAVPSATSIQITASTSNFGDAFANSTPSGSETVTRQDLLVRLALIPSNSAVSLANSLVRHFEETIISGALYHVQSMPGAPWNDPSSAGLHLQEYMLGQERARSMGDDENMVKVRRRVAYGGL